MRYAWRFGPFLAALALVPLPLRADEQLVPLAMSGDWAALAHKADITSPPDVCVLTNPVRQIAFRAASSGFEIRVTNENWSLPINVSGTIQMKVGDIAKSYDISANTDTMIVASISEAEILEIFGAMDKSSSMLVTVGKSKPFSVSLNGSSRATNAFRTCAGLAGNDKKGGENPFQ